MRSCVGQSNDHEPCVKYLKGVISGGLTLNGRINLQHGISLVPTKFMLYIHCRLRLDDKANQAQY